MSIFVGGVVTENINGKRKEHDVYETEPAAIEAYINLLKDNHRTKQLFFNDGGSILDVGCGDGRWLHAFQQQHTYEIAVGVDIRDLRHQDSPFVFIRANFIDKLAVTGKFKVIAGNPPYKFAEAFLERSFELVDKQRGVVSFLLPLSILGSHRRYTRFFNTGFPISRICVYNTRVSFSEDGKTYPGREYAQFEWIFNGGVCLTSNEAAHFYSINPIEHLIYTRT